MIRVFLSHSSTQKPIAREIQKTLKAREVEVWLDEKDLRAGELLRNELQKALTMSEAVILLWSEEAAESRWVLSEMLMGFHLGRALIPCVVDDSPLPQFLQRSAYIDLRNDRAAAIERLAQTAVTAQPGATNVPRRFSALDRATREVTEGLARFQAEEMKRLLRSDLEGASELHQQIDPLMKDAELARPLEIEVLKLAGFHRKNAYLVRHWQAIQAGRGPSDPILLEAERKFFEALMVYPRDSDCLDGLGSVLMLERELDAAAFFETNAIRLAAFNGVTYDAAWENLRLIRSHKPAAPIPPQFGTGPGTPQSFEAATRYCSKGGRSQQAGQYAEALVAYEWALVNDATRSEAHIGRGLALLHLDRLDDGLDAINLAVRLDPRSPYTHSALGAALIGAGRVQEGLEAADRALELAPGFPEPMYSKACGYSILEEGEEALTWLRRAVESYPPFMDQAREDPHFDFLRKRAELGSRFGALVEE